MGNDVEFFSSQMCNIFEQLKFPVLWKNIYTIYNKCSLDFPLYIYNAGQNRAFYRPLQQYWASLKWFSIPASVGFAFICYQQFWHVRRREYRNIHSTESSDLVANKWQVGGKAFTFFKKFLLNGRDYHIALIKSQPSQ